MSTHSMGAYQTAVAALAVILTIAPRLAGQVVRGVVRDSATGRPIEGAMVTVASDSAPVCSVTVHADGRFRCTAPAGVSLVLAARRIGYEPVASIVGAVAKRDSIDVTVTLGAAVRLDTVRIVDSSAHGLFSVTPGRVQFQRHMALGKGHFISGFDIQRSGMLLSEYLVAHLDSLKLVSISAMNARIPMLPVGNHKFLTSTVKGLCLYGRIDRWNIGPLLRQRARPDIDVLLRPDEVIGVEVYLDYHDVPVEWRMDAFPSNIYWLYGTWLGNIGLPTFTGPPIGWMTSGPQAKPIQLFSNLVPTCPLLQIWTRLAW